MIRMAEYYESPRFKGKFFTLEEFKKWYISTKKKTKRFTYYEDWTGYNIPSKALKPFLTGRFNPLSKKEKRVIDLLKDIKGKYYVIGTFRRNRSEQETIDHEVTHALFAFEKGYNKKVQKYLKNKDTKELQKRLTDYGYSDAVMNDEMNAYLTNDLKWLRKKKIKGLQYDKYSKDLIAIRKPYWS